jgi:hypothetical protein
LTAGEKLPLACFSAETLLSIVVQLGPAANVKAGGLLKFGTGQKLKPL